MTLPASVIIDESRAQLTGQGYQLDTRIQMNGEDLTIRYDVDLSRAGWVASASDLTALDPVDTPLGLLMAMAHGSPLQLARICPPSERQPLETLQALFTAWTNGDLKRVEILDGFQPINPDRRPGTKVGAFFSGGVDSWYTLLTHRSEIDCLILVHGFDVPLARPDLWAAREKVMVEALQALGKPSILIRTNVRELCDTRVDWPWFHGVAMVAAARILAPYFRRFYLSSTLDYAHLMPLGSHPAVDWLWGRPGLQIEHDGCETPRLAKVARIVQSPEALGSLRVCWKNIDGPYNCSYCRKCVLTQLALEALGALDRASTFDSSRLPSLIPELDSEDPVARVYLEEILAYQKQTGRNNVYRRLLEERLARRSGRSRGGHWLSDVGRILRSFKIKGFG